MKEGDPRLRPILTVAEVAELVQMATPTLYSWLRPAASRPPLIRGVAAVEHRGEPSLSVIGLAEVHTAHALRSHNWTMPQLIKFARREQQVDPYALATPRLLTDEIDVFVEQDDELSRLWDRQIPFSEVVRPLLRELVPWEDDRTGAYRPAQLQSDLVEIDPRFNSGRMSFRRNRVPLFAVAGALRAGEDAETVASSLSWLLRAA